MQPIHPQSTWPAAWKATAAATLGLGLALPALAVPLTPVAFSGVVDSAAQTVTFGIAFNRAPDFATVDGAGRMADGIQYWINADTSSTLTPVEAANADIAYGAVASNTVEVVSIASAGTPAGNGAASGLLDVAWVTPYQNADYSDTDRSPGGWGIVQAQVSYTLTGASFAFTVPEALLRDTDGRLTTQIAFTEFGSSAGLYTLSVPAAIPEPASWAMLGLGLTAVAAIRRRQTKR